MLSVLFFVVMTACLYCFCSKVVLHLFLPNACTHILHFFAAATLEVHDMEGGETQVKVHLSGGATGGETAAQGSGAAVSPEGDGTIGRGATEVTGLTLPTPPKDFGTIFLTYL